MTKYVLEFFEWGQRSPTYRSVSDIPDTKHPRSIDDEDSFNGSIRRAFDGGEITKVIIRYESNGSIAAEARKVKDTPGHIRWFKRVR